MKPSVVCWLGPQRHVPTVRSALDAVLPDGGRIALVSAGWEEREREVEEFEAHVTDRHPVVQLAVFERVEDCLHRDADLRRSWQARNDERHTLQELYRLRLGHALDAVRELFEREAPDELLEPERDAAIDAVRQLDHAHQRRVEELNRKFFETWRAHESPLVRKHRGEVEHELADCRALCLAGGHVGVLLDRLRLLDVLGASERSDPTRPLIAWSAGAMTLGSKVVLFHDSPPQGVGDAEIWDPGFAVLPGAVALPHADKRLRLGDPDRVRILARRFRGDDLVLLEDGVRLEWRGTECRSEGSPRRSIPSDPSPSTPIPTGTPGHPAPNTPSTTPGL